MSGGVVVLAAPVVGACAGLLLAYLQIPLRRRVPSVCATALVFVLVAMSAVSGLVDPIGGPLFALSAVAVGWVYSVHLWRAEGVGEVVPRSELIWAAAFSPHRLRAVREGMRVAAETERDVPPT